MHPIFVMVNFGPDFGQIQEVEGKGEDDICRCSSTSPM